MLVASTRKTRFALSNSARVILTVSVLGGGGGAPTALIVSVALRVTPSNVPLITAFVVAVTLVVLTVKLADVAPAATVTLAGTEAAALLLARVTTVAAGAAAFNVTLPWTAFPPTTVLDDNVIEDNESGVGVGAAGVTVTVKLRRPSWLFRILILMFCVELTALVVAVNLTLEVPPAMNTFEGTWSTVELLLETENEKPFEGATAPGTKLILISVEFPPTTVAGAAVTLP